MTQAEADHLAADWYAAWNAHDLDAVMPHYAEQIEFRSPLVPQLMGRADGCIRDLATLRDYFGRGLAAYPDLRFTPYATLPGIDSVVLLYRSVKGRLSTEWMQVDAAGKICTVRAHYTEMPATFPGAEDLGA